MINTMKKFRCEIYLLSISTINSFIFHVAQSLEGGYLDGNKSKLN